MEVEYNTVIISDLHLGSKYSMKEDINNFLDNIKCKTLILNGDIIDGWALKRGSSWDKEDMKCVRKIMKKSYKTDVYWIRGNHDDFLSDFIPINFGNINAFERMDYTSLNGKKYLIVHGDIFDIFTTNMKWIAKIGSLGYDFTLFINKWYNKFLILRGKEYFSLSQMIKNSVKSATNFIGDFENHMINYVKEMKYDGVICGHIHKAEIREMDGIEYMNSGDWVESKTALVEDMEGKWSILKF